MTMKMMVEKEKQAQRLLARSQVFVLWDVHDLEKQLAPFLERGETMPDVALLMKLAMRRVIRLVEKLDQTVRDDLTAGAGLLLAREDRGDASKQVTAGLKSQRDLFSGATADRHLTDPVPSQPHALLRRAEVALRALRETAPGRPELRGVTIEPERLAAGFQPGVDDLRGALKRVEEGEAEVRLAKELKRQAKAAFDVGFGLAHRLLEALTALAGRRIRLLETGFKHRGGR